MGCEYCEYTDYGKHDCTATLSYRKNFCEVYFPGEYRKKKQIQIIHHKKRNVKK